MQRSELTEAVAAWLEWLETKRRIRPTSLRKFRSQLKLGFERVPDPWAPEDLLPSIEHRLGPKATPSTRRGTWDATSLFFRWWERNGGPANPLAEARAPRQSTVRREALTAAEVSTLEARMEQAHPRDRAMVSLLLGAGCRVGDLIAMRCEDVDLEAGRLRLRDGKGGTDARLPIAPAVISAVRAWLELPPSAEHDRRRAPAPQSPDDRLFPGRSVDGAISAWAIALTFRRVAGGDLPGHCPHELRHTFLTRLANEGRPIQVIQALARHSSVATTGRYLHASPEQLRQAVGQLDPEPTPQPPGALSPRHWQAGEDNSPALANGPSTTSAIAFTVAGSPPLYLLADVPIGALAADLQEVLRDSPDAAPLTLPMVMAEWLSDDFRGLTTARPATSALRELVVDEAARTASVLTSMGETVRSWSWDAFSSLDWYGDDRPGELIEPGWTARMTALDSQPDPGPPDPGPPYLRVLGALGGTGSRREGIRPRSMISSGVYTSYSRPPRAASG